MIKFQPEPIDAMQRRLHQALVNVYNGTESTRPGQQRKHVFDFENGRRLIISANHDFRSGGEPCLHVSMNHVPRFMGYKDRVEWVSKFRNIRHLVAEFFQDAERHFSLLLPPYCPQPRDHFITPGRFHLIYRDRVLKITRSLAENFRYECRSDEWNRLHMPKNQETAEVVNV